MIFSPQVIKCQETSSLLWFLKSTSLPCCNFLIVTLFLVVIAGYTCTKWDTLTSEDDLCTSVLRDLTDVTKLASRHVSLLSHFEVSHQGIFISLIYVHLCYSEISCVNHGTANQLLHLIKQTNKQNNNNNKNRKQHPLYILLISLWGFVASLCHLLVMSSIENRFFMA